MNFRSLTSAVGGDQIEIVSNIVMSKSNLCLFLKNVAASDKQELLVTGLKETEDLRAIFNTMHHKCMVSKHLPPPLLYDSLSNL